MAADLVLAVEVSASPDALYDAITTSDGLAGFWTKDSEAEPSVGSVARFGFGPEAVLRMRVDELVPGKRIRWTCLGDFPNWQQTAVTWDLRRDGVGPTTVVFRHGKWSPDLAEDYNAHSNYTWATILTALKAYAESKHPAPVFG
jgi:uncharacterized protein YndB with AHSA1/START domain